MSKQIGRETLDSLRQPVVQAVRDAAKANRVSIDADALAMSSQPGLLVVNAPIAGVEKLDFLSLLDGRPVLDDVPVMYWHLSGDRLGEEESPIPAGFYTVVAHGRRGRVSLRDAEGTAIAGGDLDIGIEPSTTGTAERKVTGGITSVDADAWPPHIKVCGYVKVCQGKVCVKVSGCVEAGF